VELTLENIVESYENLWKIDENTWLLKKILSDKQNRSLSFGISSILNTSIPLPVKTGTSTDFRDNWTLSYSDNAIIGVWVGNADSDGMQDVSWVSGAWPIWKKIAEHLIEIWLIREEKEFIPPWVHEKYFCFDRSCLRREQSWEKIQKKQTSFPKDNIFFHSDFLWNISDAERVQWNIQE
jgi:membrane carboxypeptidase/penicillin-binding protein PbpC